MDVVQHNLLAMNANRQFHIVDGRRKKSTEKLSSGYRINRSADDAAGLSISEKMRSQIRGLDKGNTNAMDGLSLLQVADGAMTETLSMMHRLTELSVQAANDTNTPEDRRQLQHEVAELLSEIDRVAEDTEFNTQKVFPQRKKSSGADTPAVNGAALLTPGSPQYGGLIGTHVFSADESGLTLDGETVSWSSAGYDALGGNAGTLEFSFSGSGAKLQLTVGEGASVSDIASAVDGASYTVETDPAYYINYEGMPLDDRGVTSGTVAVSSSREMTWSLETDPLHDALAHLLADEDTLHAVPLSIKPVGELSIYPQRSPGEAWFDGDEGGSAVHVRYTMDEDALDHWLSQDASEKNPDEIPVSFSYANGGLESSFTMYLKTDKDLSTVHTAAELFSGMGTVEKLHSKIEWVHGDFYVTDMTLPEGQSKGPLEDKAWWIQTSSLDQEGFFIKTGAVDTESLGLTGLDVSTGEGAQDAIDRVSKGIERLTAEKGRVGAQENRLEHASAIIQNTSENTQAAESRLRDLDMASEVVDYFRENVLSNIGESMMVQANQSTNSVLTLLG